MPDLTKKPEEPEEPKAHFLNDLGKNTPFSIKDAYKHINILRDQLQKTGIVGQDELIDHLLLAMIMGEHCLLEGLPGLAKTEISKELARLMGLDFRRIQFVPDMMPTELIQQIKMDFSTPTTKFAPVPGPVFCNILLADEINRASPKVQAALLEATEERKVTLPSEEKDKVIRSKKETNLLRSTHNSQGMFGLDRITGNEQSKYGQNFMVLATMNPIEQEGVYPLSEAQLDRFVFNIIINQPTQNHFKDISHGAFSNPDPDEKPPTPDEVKKLDDIRKENHLKTLYFFTSLREQLFGYDAYNLWEKNTIRPPLEHFINFTHARSMGDQPVDTGFGNRISRREENLKQLELKVNLSIWRDGDSTMTNAKKRWVERLTNHFSRNFPEISSGVSPRGLIKLVRAIHARAFLKRGNKDKSQLQPQWDDLEEVALPVLRHRIRLASHADTQNTDIDNIIQSLLQCFQPLKEKS